MIGGNFNDPATPKHVANSITQTAAGIAGGGATDGSIAYRQLHESDNPYDPKFNPATGEVTVREIVPVSDDDERAAADTKRDH